MKPADLIAGCALASPQPSYTLTSTPEAMIVFSRDEWSLLAGHVTLTPNPEWRAQHPSVYADKSVSFQIKKLKVAWSPPTEQRPPEAALFSLLVEHHLLSRPGLITEREPTPPTLSNALAGWQKRYRAMTKPQSFLSAYCDHCERRQWHLLSRRPVYRAERIAEELCPHQRLLAPAFKALSLQAPELLFELLGLLEPERDAKKAAPVRYTLTREAFIAALLESTIEAPHKEKRSPLSAKPVKPSPRLEQLSCSAEAWGFTSLPTLPNTPPQEPPAPKPAMSHPEPPEAPRVMIEAPPTRAPIEAPPTRPEGIPAEGSAFLQRIGEENPTLSSLLQQLKTLPEPLQQRLGALSMRRLIDELYDLDEELEE